MNHYKYMSTKSARFSVHYDDAPDPVQPPGAGWELMGQCAIAENEHMCFLIWSWRQLAFTTPIEA